MPEWLLERGVGETRAALVNEGAIVELRLERESDRPRVGAVLEAVVGPPAGLTDRTQVTVEGLPALLRGRAPVAEGARLRVEVVREAIPERGNPKPPVVVPAPDKPLGAGPALHERLEGAPVTLLPPFGPDRLEAAGWGEAMEAARTGLLPFPGGLLRIVLTPAMTVIDVDGGLAPGPLALAGAEAAARAIRLFDIGGSIGIDLPSAGDKGVRTAAAEVIDRILPQPFERTAVNGFGFVQIVRRRPRASVMERVQADPALTAALALLRVAGRDPRGGPIALVARSSVTARIAADPAWLEALGARRGAAVTLRTNDALAISAGHVEPLSPR